MIVAARANFESILLQTCAVDQNANSASLHLCCRKALLVRLCAALQAWNDSESVTHLALSKVLASKHQARDGMQQLCHLCMRPMCTSFGKGVMLVTVWTRKADM